MITSESLFRLKGAGIKGHEHLTAASLRRYYPYQVPRVRVKDPSQHKSSPRAVLIIYPVKCLSNNFIEK